MNPFDEASVTLERTPCYGTCPVYTVTLRGDGTATWHGEYFVEPEGHRIGEVNPRDVERILAFADHVAFFSWEPEYSELVTDHPGTRITIERTRRKSHTVFQYATDRPPDFWTLATLIDGVRALIDWRDEGFEAPPG